MDVSHVYCGADGWAHLVAVIDCHDRRGNVGLCDSRHLHRGMRGQRHRSAAALRRHGTAGSDQGVLLVSDKEPVAHEHNMSRAAVLMANTKTW